MVSQLSRQVKQLAVALLIMNAAEPSWCQVYFEHTESSVIVHYRDSLPDLNLNRGLWQPEETLKVFVGTEVDSIATSTTPILGNYLIAPGQIKFEPVIPFNKNLQYFAIFADSAVYKFSVSNSNHLTTELIGIYPTADTLPENLLKIYLEFTGPMREGLVYDKVHIKGPDGLMVNNPFVPLEPELWDQSERIITLWIDPGRVKRSLLSREAYGPVIEAGKRYQLVVDSTWQDTHGQQLNQVYSKSFFVASADRNKPTTRDWQLKVPTEQSMDPLSIYFDSPMDHATAKKAFAVYDSQGKMVVGIVALTEMEQSWVFTPDHKWKPGKYTIEVESRLEDLAGNNLNRVFDRDLSIDSQAPSEMEYYELHFEISNGTP